MLRDYLSILGNMQSDGSGVGLSVIVERTAMSKYKVRKMLKELIGLNFVYRKGNVFFRNAFGTAIVVADNEAWGAYLMGENDGQ